MRYYFEKLENDELKIHVTIDQYTGSTTKSFDGEVIAAYKRQYYEHFLVRATTYDAVNKSTSELNDAIMKFGLGLGKALKSIKFFKRSVDKDST